MIKRFFEEHKGARRLSLLWAVCLITVVVLRVTSPEIITQMNAAGATVVSGVVGILTVVVGFYQWDRAQDRK